MTEKLKKIIERLDVEFPEYKDYEVTLVEDDNGILFELADDEGKTDSEKVNDIKVDINDLLKAQDLMTDETGYVMEYGHFYNDESLESMADEIENKYGNKITKIIIEWLDNENHPTVKYEFTRHLTSDEKDEVDEGIKTLVKEKCADLKLQDDLEEIHYLRDRILEYERKGIGSEAEYEAWKDKLEQLLDMEYNEEKHIYIFPELTDEDKEVLEDYNLTYLGHEGENCIVEGYWNDLDDYTQLYLGYEMDPERLYEPGEYQGKPKMNDEGDRDPNAWMTKEYQDELDREHEEDEHENSWMSEEYQDELDREFEDEEDDATLNDVDSEIKVGKTYTSKSGHKLTVDNVYVGFSEYDGSAVVRINYSYEKTDGKKGNSVAYTEDFHRMLNDSTNEYDIIYDNSVAVDTEDTFEYQAGDIVEVNQYGQKLKGEIIRAAKPGEVNPGLNNPDAGRYYLVKTGNEKVGYSEELIWEGRLKLIGRVISKAQDGYPDHDKMKAAILEAVGDKIAKLSLREYLNETYVRFVYTQDLTEEEKSDIRSKVDSIVAEHRKLAEYADSLKDADSEGLGDQFKEDAEAIIKELDQVVPIDSYRELDYYTLNIVFGTDSDESDDDAIELMLYFDRYSYELSYRNDNRTNDIDVMRIEDVLEQLGFEIH